jgi:oligoribonuclease NrnB/cAMP/cGMP phosphodiesterase (DHH superfamily)
LCFITCCIAEIGTKLQNPIIFYHHPCPDGTSAALAAFLKFGDSATYVPVNYGHHENLIKGCAGQNIYFLDFSPPREVLMGLCGVCESVTILDHHKTAEKNLEFLSFPNLQIIFDMTKSGAMLAYEFFIPEDSDEFDLNGKQGFFEKIQDRDLWQFKLEGTKELAAYLQSMPLTIEAYNKVYGSYVNMDDELIFSAGTAILRMQDCLVERMAARPSILLVAGVPVIAANAPVLHSEVGHYLLEKYPYSPFAATWLFDGLKVYLSLRSRKDGSDVSEIAKQVNSNAGGHKNAAGAEITPEILAEMLRAGVGFDVSGSPAV